MLTSASKGYLTSFSLSLFAQFSYGDNGPSSQSETKDKASASSATASATAPLTQPRRSKATSPGLTHNLLNPERGL